MKQDVKGRRRLVAGLGAAATAVAMGSRTKQHRRPHTSCRPGIRRTSGWAR